MKKQVSLRDKKRLLTLAKKNGNISEYMASLGRKNAGIKKPTSGFADPTIGEDGLTGRERAVAAGRKGGRRKRTFKL